MISHCSRFFKDQRCCLQVAYTGRLEMKTWLEENRLARHELKIANICGRDIAPDDLNLLDDDDMAEICTIMTRVEFKRFSAAAAARRE